jgi:hypothetical protein
MTSRTEYGLWYHLFFAKCVSDGTVAHWLLCVKQDGEQAETVL